MRKMLHECCLTAISGGSHRHQSHPGILLDSTLNKSTLKRRLAMTFGSTVHTISRLPHQPAV